MAEMAVRGAVDGERSISGSDRDEQEGEQYQRVFGDDAEEPRWPDDGCHDVRDDTRNGWRQQRSAALSGEVTIAADAESEQQGGGCSLWLALGIARCSMDDDAGNACDGHDNDDDGLAHLRARSASEQYWDRRLLGT